MAIWKRDRSEFKPDAVHGTFLKTLRMTRQQKLRLSKWLLYGGLLILSMVVQDVMLSRFRFSEPHRSWW